MTLLGASLDLNHAKFKSCSHLAHPRQAQQTLGKRKVSKMWDRGGSGFPGSNQAASCYFHCLDDNPECLFGVIGCSGDASQGGHW